MKNEHRTGLKAARDKNMDFQPNVHEKRGGHTLIFCRSWPRLLRGILLASDVDSFLEKDPTLLPKFLLMVSKFIKTLL